MDINLINEIHSFTEDINGFIELDKAKSYACINMVAQRYVNNRNKLWWWENLAQASVELEYHNNNGLHLLRKIINNDNVLIRLFVTDDEPEPWPVFQGELKTIISIISGQRFFEYFISPVDFSWLIFDTHHNSLIVLGDLLKSAQREKNIAGMGTIL